MSATSPGESASTAIALPLPPITVLQTDRDVHRVVSELHRESCVAVDIESNGLFRYRPSICTVQLATAREVFIVDTLAASPNTLAPLLGAQGPRKILHDVSFDARLLADSGIELANVFDTQLAARMLGRTATGLASLMQAELGISIDKALQHHDWTARPLRAHHIEYLARDVMHLASLAERLERDVRSLGIGQAVEEETRYRLEQAFLCPNLVDPRPPYTRLKGIDRTPASDLPVLRRLADVREKRAKSLDVPPYKVLGPDVLFDIARKKPTSFDELSRIKGATSGARARSLAPALLEAVRLGQTDGPIPETERALFERPRLTSSVVKARRAREVRLTSWRRAEAKKRGVDEQVVLPGHCLQDLASLAEEASLDVLTKVPGIGRFRIEQDGAAIVEALAARPSDALARE